MIRTSRLRVMPLAAALLLLAASAGGVSAAKQTKSFDATFCYSTDFEGLTPAIVATVTWSGQLVDAVSIGTGDGTGAGFGAVEPLSKAAKSGSVTLGIGADDSNVVAGADIRFHNKIPASEEISRPGSSWSGLPAC